LRRSGLPVARSQGFSPRPLVAFGLALPTGAESLAEYLDVTLTSGEDGSVMTQPGSDCLADLGTLATALSEFLPDGVDVVALAALASGASSLQQEVTSCSWELEVLGVTATELVRRGEHLLDAPTVPVQRERKGRHFDDDLRPSVRSLTLFEPPEASPASASSRGWLR